MTKLPASTPGNPEYAFDRKPEPAEGVDICAGICWYRVPLPFALNHVNCWLLNQPDEEHVLVDTGINDSNTRKLWQQVLPASAANTTDHDRPPFLKRLLVTHFHPDHMGLAGWFGKNTCELLGSADEVAVANRLYAIADTDYSATHASWYRTHGLPAEVVDNVLANGNTYANKLCQPPPSQRWQKLSDGQWLTLAGQRYQVLVGRGHAPDMTMLYRESDHVLIAADQVLPGISPNVSVMPALSDDNPLRSFLDSLTRLRQLPSDTLVLPSHGIPFRGLHERLEVLHSHHDQRLNLVLDACAQPVTAYDLFSELYGIGRKLDAQQTSFALGESLAHLHYLESQGQVTRHEDSDITRFSAR